MNDAVYLRDYTSHKSVSLVITVCSTVERLDALITLASIMRRRFSTKIVFAFSEPELLFFNYDLVRAISRGLAEKFYIADSPANFWFDVVEWAKRQEEDRVILCDASTLEDDITSLIKFNVEVMTAVFESAGSPCWNFAAISKDKLRKSNVRPNSFKTMLNALLLPERNRNITSLRCMNARRSLYVTKEGLQRYRGESTFRNLNISIGGYKPSEFSRLWVVDNDLKVDDFLKTPVELLKEQKTVLIPGLMVDSGAKSSKLILDVNPGAYEANVDVESALPKMSAPRTIITASALPCEIRPAAESVVFAMSNFNKAPYIFGALYSISMQTVSSLTIKVIDDGSTDGSFEIAKTFAEMLDLDKIGIAVVSNAKSKGTYWIRNSIIHELVNKPNAVYLVNDSDDFSSFQRALIQLSILDPSHPQKRVCFGDIVRVDRSFQVLPLDGKVERYGTASLGATVDLHVEYGFYETLRKNADTEFIERIKHFGGKDSVMWFRYPVLFQPFDGNNLTADIYTVGSLGIKQTLSARDRHKALFKERHLATDKSKLALEYAFPNYQYPKSYVERLSEFLLEE